jgi:hypothetical protein
MTMLEVNDRKAKAVRLLGEVDIAELREQVLTIPEHVWNAENADKPNPFGALDATRHIVFRFVDNWIDWRQSHDRGLWAEWKALIEPILRKATEPYGYANGEFPRVMLARMAPGGIIHPHVDENPAAKWPHKIHVPLVTNPDVTFFVDGQGYYFEEGVAVEVNNMKTHAVSNRGTTDRIHLIFEYFDRDQPAPHWLEPMIAANVR